jgi:tetratricopeptide (TPR) repeat protein/tRNA A-37 threonylcarbamoyl transferase component Bud32
MPCPRCGSVAASPSGRCRVCGTVIGADAGAATALLTPVPNTGAKADAPGALETVLGTEEETRLDPSPVARTAINTGPLAVGHNFGPRYHIIRCIGSGGMGAVYQAWDQELEVAVAVKVIRPDPGGDPAMAEELERRFKRELLLARQVTHKNVVRIHDIGELGGVKYITMPYVQGADLATILKREHRLSPARAITIGRQIVEGLVAAHEAGVVHRDLKPANVMVDAEDHALIMDFGIARSTSSGAGFAMTVAGAVIGTIEYMAPEQARGEAVDQRADVYALGLILRDMVLGGRHAGGTTAVAELMSRMQGPPASLRTVDPTLPEGLDAVVTKCLQPNVADRYPSSAALLKDLERLSSGTAVAAGSDRRRVRPVHAAIAAPLVLVLALGGYALYGGRPDPSAPGASAGTVTTLGVLPFRNATGDPALNSLGVSLSEVLATDLGEAQSIRLISPQRLQEVLRDLRIDPQTNLSGSDLTRIANFANAGTVLWGQYVKFGDEIRIDATLQDLRGDRRIPLKATAPNQAGLLLVVTQLASEIQAQLARGSADVLKELQASAWRPSTASVVALGAYNEGLQLSRQGNHQTALKRFQDAIHEDGNFALAHSALAQSYSTLGYDAEAAQYSRRALEMSESMPAGHEKYLIAAAYYRIANESDKAIETYERLLSVAPNNAGVHFALAELHEGAGSYDKAQEHYGQAVALDPKHIAGLTAVGRVNIRRGDPQKALDPLNKALSLAVELDNDEARGTALQALGIAYKRMSRPDDALRHYEQSLEIKRKLDDKRGMSSSLSEIAQVQETLGRPQEALKSYTEALALQRAIGNQSGMAMTLINQGALLNETLGRPDDALPLLREALEITRDTGNKSAEGLAFNNIGSAYFAKGEYSEARTYFDRALEIREAAKVPHEIADTLHSLGETLNRMGRFDQALTHYLRALKLRRDNADRRMEAIESYSIGTVFDYQGRHGAAVRSKTEALDAFRALNVRDVWLGEILIGHGLSLAQSGRIQDAAKSLQEALALAKELQHSGLLTQTLRADSDRLRYAGDLGGAARLAEQAVQASAGTSDRSLQLWAQAQVARIAAATAPARGQAAALSTLSGQAAATGSVYLSVLTSLEGAEALLRVGDHRGARQTISGTLARAESLGLRELHARSEYVLGDALRMANDAAARRHYAAALRILDDMAREDGSGRVLERADLKAVHAECTRWAKGS